ncbi:MAG: glutamate--cysteine ligase [Pseudomonadota bacterium]
MRKELEKNINLLINKNLGPLLKIGKIGIEKECLRTDLQGVIASTDHPISLGSALTHPYITTDYSEALLEFVTPPLASSQQAINFLSDIHKFVYSNLQNECLWPASMPCRLNGDNSIRIAEYGKSNLGMMKHVYRKGLGYRYGKIMQVIAGIHVNLSLPDQFWGPWQQALENNESKQEFSSAQYFKLIRNLQRVGWLIPYLFGASPSVDKSFTHEGIKDLKQWDQDTLFAPYATSLRLGDIGYTNHRENEIGVNACYDNLADYVNCLTHAIETPYRPYEEIGVKVNGEYRQLNSNILQIENEYYGVVRPKQVANRKEKPTHALLDRGVSYVEIRSLDINPYSPFGIDVEQMYFIEVLFVYCLLGEEAIIDRAEREGIDINSHEVSHYGRRLGLHLRRKEESILLQEWANEIFDDLAIIAELMDSHADHSYYTNAVKTLRICIDSIEHTLSARILADMHENKWSYYEFVENIGKKYCKTVYTAESEIKSELAEAVDTSFKEQHRIELDDHQSFDEFLAEYFAQKHEFA